MTTTFPGSFAGQTVTLTFDRASFGQPDSVLVYAFYKKELLFTYNRKRGWELPGGKIEPGEFPVAAAVREVYEETGAELEAIQPIGQYRVDAPNEPTMIKTIYVARIRHIHPQPEGFETDAVRLYGKPPGPEDIGTDESFSPLLRDNVYPLALEKALQHAFAR